jgi:hypothetical protein
MRGVVVAGVIAMVAGCGAGLPKRIALMGTSATLQAGCQVNFQDAWVREKDIRVKLWVANMSQAFMMIDRDGFGMRLGDGREIRRVGAVHNVYTLPPGGGHAVFVDFRDPGTDMRTHQNVSLIVGGISFSTDPRPRVVGEVPLVQAGPQP